MGVFSVFHRGSSLALRSAGSCIFFYLIQAFLPLGCNFDGTEVLLSSCPDSPSSLVARAAPGCAAAAAEEEEVG